MNKDGLVPFKERLREQAREFIELAGSPFTDEQKSAALVEILARVFDDLDASSYTLILQAEGDEDAEAMTRFVEALDRLSPTPAQTDRAF